MLVELCAGSAAVSLRWLSARGKPPLAYVGGKRGYADQILHALGLAPGGGKVRQVVLCEPGPWGDAWSLWRTAEGRADTIARLEAWQDEDPRTLWERLRAAPVPEDECERVAVWAVLQFWSFARKPVTPAADWKESGFDRGAAYRRSRWDNASFNAAEAYEIAYHAEYTARTGKYRWGGGQDARLPDVIAALRALPDLSRLAIHRCRAEDVEPIPGSVVLIDPPYQGTTCAYGHDLPRADVLALAERWRRAGCVVAVCEQEPLPLAGWHHHELGGPSGFGRTWSKQRREFLTISRPAAGQLSLLSETTVCA